jgi:hypothetical protein
LSSFSIKRWLGEGWRRGFGSSKGGNEVNFKPTVNGEPKVARRSSGQFLILNF